MLIKSKMKVEWNNCFLCLNDLGGVTACEDGADARKKTAQVTLLLNYLLDGTIKHSGLISEVKELLVGSGSLVRVCDKCEAQLKRVSKLHQELEVVQMKLVAVLMSVKKTVILGSKRDGGGGYVGLGIFEEWLKEQEEKTSGGNLEEEGRLRKQRKILETLYGFQAGVVENDKGSLNIPRILLEKCTHFRPEPPTQPDPNCSEILVKTEAGELNDFQNDVHSPDPLDEFFEHLSDIELPPPTKKTRRRKRKKVVSNEVKQEIDDIPRRKARTSSSVARLRITEIKNQSQKPKRIKKEPSSDDLNPPLKRRQHIPAAFSLKKLKPNSSKTKYHHPNSYYACAVCDFAHLNQFSFEQHLRTHEVPVADQPSNSHSLPMYHCEKCAITFSVQQNYQFHMACHDGQITTHCDACNMTIEPLNMTEHMKTHLDQIEKIFPCPHCSFCCSTREKYLFHLPCHDTKTCKQECDICRMTFLTRKKLLQHYHTVHQAIDQLVCDGCPKTFLDPNMLRLHRKIHEKRFVCPHCQTSLSSKTSLRSHVLLHTGEKPFACDRENCSESFTLKPSLERHLIRDHGAPKLKCEYCNKEFSERCSLRIHTTRFHTGSEFVCEVENCGKQCATATLLRRHILSHSSERKFVCDVCGSSFKLADSLKRHKLTHGGEKKFKCRFCGKAFLFEKYLIPHLRIHTGEKPFVCDACGKDFNQYAALYMHKRKCHMGETPPDLKMDISDRKFRFHD